MIKETNKKRNYPIGPYSTFVAPFRATGLWVEDARGLSVCECPDYDVAEGLAKILNERN
jgi:hypothetical protein